MSRELHLKVKLWNLMEICDYLNDSHEELKELKHGKKIITDTIKSIAKEMRLIEREYSEIYSGIK